MHAHTPRRFVQQAGVLCCRHGNSATHSPQPSVLACDILFLFFMTVQSVNLELRRHDAILAAASGGGLL